MGSLRLVGPVDDRWAGSGFGCRSTPAESVTEIEMHDFAFVGFPDSVPAGTRLEVGNHAESELYELVVFKLADGEERRAADLAGLHPHELEATPSGLVRPNAAI